MKRNLRTLTFALFALFALHFEAGATTFVIDAHANSVSGGSLFSTGISFVAGQAFQVRVGIHDLWSHGSLPRYSNADGSTGNLFASAVDDSGYPTGTLIGIAYPLYTLKGITAPVGSLVGEIANTYFLVGTNFNGSAPTSGVLRFTYWDANNSDNFGTITADVRPVPEPSTHVLGAIGAIVVLLHRRRIGSPASAA